MAAAKHTSKRYYNIKQAAEILGCTIQTIYDHRCKKTRFGMMFVYRGLGRRPVISEDNLFDVRDNGWK